MKDYKRIKDMRNLNDSLIWKHMKRCYDYGYEDGKADTPFTDTEEAEKKAYDRGLADMLEVFKSMRMWTADDLEEVFGLRFIGDIIVNLSPSKIVSKYHAFMARIKELEDAEIRVGDEVYSEEDDLTFIVTRIRGTKYEGICTDGACYNGLPDDIVKTGRTFPQIAEVLAELRGAENDE